MNHFEKVLAYVDERVYKPHGFKVSSVREEAQNADYGACVFRLNELSVRFRVAKITPNKTGQFVVFWEKDRDRQNQAFSQDNATDLLVIHTIGQSQCYGQFVFPKTVLEQQGILKSAAVKGKMAIRVYPEWDVPTSKQAMATQKWQLPYFVAVHNDSHVQRLVNLYAMACGKQ